MHRHIMGFTVVTISDRGESHTYRGHNIIRGIYSREEFKDAIRTQDSAGLFRVNGDVGEPDTFVSMKVVGDFTYLTERTERTVSTARIRGHYNTVAEFYNAQKSQTAIVRSRTIGRNKMR